MADFEKLIDIELQTQYHKEEKSINEGFKLYLFEALYSIQQFYGLYKFLDIIFIIIEFIQLMAFPMDKAFDKSWGDTWVNTIGNFFRYFQLMHLWHGTSFSIIAYILTIIYIIILLSLFLNILIKYNTVKSNVIIIGITIMLQLLIILNVPFLRTLFSVFSCENDVVVPYQEIKCKSVTHIILIIISILFIIILKCFIIIIHSTIYEFGYNSNILKSGYSSLTDIVLDIIKILLVIIYQFISNEIALAIITLTLSVIILVHFMISQPYSNEFTMKLYLILYLFFCWSCIICLISIFLRNSEFKSGLVLLMLGYPFIMIIFYLKESEYYIEKLLFFILAHNNNEYNALLNIEFFLKLEDSLAEKIKTKDNKLLFTYIINHESKCAQKNCFIKMFMKIPFEVKKFENLKILLLQHAEMLYKTNISKQPYNIKLRISYILFLIKRMNKNLKAKNELFLLNKFETNLECSFIIFKIQKYLDEHDENKELDINNNYSQSFSYKIICNEIKNIIENIIVNYIKFWNILLIDSNCDNQNDFEEINKLGQKIKILNNELNKDIKSLESWNLLDQETMRIYIHYLKEILNNNEKAIKFNKKLSDEIEDKHTFDDINLYQLNYEEMSKNEDYKYIIIDLSKNDFNKISNISFSVCKEFGYMKDELIGHSSDIIFPTIFNNFRKKFFEKKVEEYKQNLFNANRIINSEIWRGDCFGINKIKFLIQFKAKWTIISSEDEKLFGVGSIYLDNKKLIDNREHEIIYILTDLNLIIQNYSSNAPEILNLNINIGNNNINISDYINEFGNLINQNEKEESNASSISNLRKNNSRMKRSSLKSEFFKKFNLLEKNAIRIIQWQKKEKEVIDINQITNKNKGFNYRKLLYSQDDDNLNFKRFNPRRGSVGNLTKNKLQRFHTVSQNYKSEMNIGTNNSNNQKETTNKNPPKLFLLKIEEAKLHVYKVGYLFILRPYKQKNELENSSAVKDLINIQEKKNINISEISIASFGEDKKKFNCSQTIIGPFNLNNQNNDFFLQNFELENDYQFTFDVKDMTYKQLKYNEQKINLYENLKDKAIKKITDAKKAVKKEEGEEEKESSENECDEDEDEEEENSSKVSKNKSEELIIKSDNNDLIEDIKENQKNEITRKKTKKRSSKKAPPLNQINQILIQNILKSANDINKKKEEEFYHVNFDKIELYIFNYSLGFVVLKKGQSHKISQVTQIINTEKEKLKHSNSKFHINPKLIKGKKKLNINKKEEENELIVHNESSLRLKEIYRVLSSTKRESVVTKIIFISILIFVLILGTGLVNILIYYKIKNSIYTFFILIKKSDNLYQNLLFEITLIKEMLILYNPYYENQMSQDRDFFYQILSKMLYNYYIDNTYIITNLTTHFNILSTKDEDSITNIEVELYILDSLKTNLLNYYQYKKYNILLYSAYRELNSALYHISELKKEEIHHFHDDVFYFLKNGMSNLLIISEEQMWKLTEKFNESITEGHLIIIICCCVIFVVYLVCTIIFVIFYKNVHLKKNKYMSMLNKLDSNLIISSLNKCEKFSQKLQERKNGKEVKNKELDFDSSSANYSENEIDNNLLDKKNTNSKVLKNRNAPKEKNKNTYTIIYVYQILIFLVIFVYQLAIYIYYYLRMTNYQRVVIYEYYLSMYAANFLFTFISLREYIFDKKTKFYNRTVDEYLEDNLKNYYMIFADKSQKKDTYRVYFPDSYQKFLNYLYNGKMCEFISAYNLDNPNNRQYKCNEFFYSSSGHGFFTLLTTFIEESRTLKGKVDNYYDIAEEKNFVYNESYYNSPNGFYQKLYDNYVNNEEEYEKYNPVNILKTDTHKELFITYNYINTQVYSFLISESLNQFEQVFKKYNNINLIINIIFLVLVVLGFCFVWIPFMYKQDKNLHKIKNMLSIVPSELLTNIPNISNLLGIEDSAM